MDVFEDRLELVGVGALPSRTIPLPAEKIVYSTSAASNTDSDSEERENTSSEQNFPRIHVSEPWLHYLSTGVKTYEGRVFKGIWRTLQPGDMVVFYNNEGKTHGADHGLTFRVTELRRYTDFDKAFMDLGKKLLPEGAETPSDALQIYRQFYPKSVVDANGGVVCVGVCSDYFFEICV